MLTDFFILSIAYLIGNQCSKARDHPGHMKPFGSNGPFLDIEKVSDLSTKNFFTNYVKPKKAVLMQNFVTKFPAFEKWSDQYLATMSNSYPDYQILLETQKKESRDQKTISLSLHDFLLLYNTSQLYMVSEVPFYLKKDVVLPQPLQCNQAPMVLEETVKLISIFDRRI